MGYTPDWKSKTCSMCVNWIDGTVNECNRFPPIPVNTTGIHVDPLHPKRLGTDQACAEYREA